MSDVELGLVINCNMASVKRSSDSRFSTKCCVAAVTLASEFAFWFKVALNETVFRGR